MGALDVLPQPVKGYQYRFGPFPILDADGDLVTAAAALDTEISKDSGTFADATNEATEVATSSGMYFIDLTATEMDAVSVGGITKTTTAGAKTTPWALYPRILPFIRSATAQAGAAGTITLDASASAKDDFYLGCLVGVDGLTGVGQIREITDYVGSTKVASVIPNWTTTPDATSTFKIYLTEKACSLAAWAGTQLTDPTTVGRPDVNLQRWLDVAPLALVAQRVEARASAMTTGLITATEAPNLDAAITTRATPAQVNTEVLDVLNVDTFAEPGQEAPPATTTLVKKLSYLFKAFRNRQTQTATTYSLYADNTTTIDQKATVSDDAVTFDRQEIGTGP